MAGILIRRLIATGIDVPTAELVFQRGLNVVSGASNTGKSYILACIDYLLGSKQLKRIGEAEKYSALFLEVETDEGIFTIERSLHGGRMLLHNGAFDAITPDSGLTLRSAHADDEENISSFLLRHAGFKAGRLRKNAQNKTVALSFRSLSQFFLVSEDRIISQASPVLAMSQEETRQHSAFEFLLSGRDQSDMEELPDPKMRKAALLAKLEMVGEMLAKITAEVRPDQTSQSQIAEELDRLEEELRLSSDALAETSREIAQFQSRRRTVFEEHREVESRRLVLDQLLGRFTLLRETYESDLGRLEFVSEADTLFSQLQTVSCPLCGTDLAQHELVAACSRVGASGEADIRRACEAERAKTNALLTDLLSTIETLRVEYSERRERAATLRKEIGEIDESLASALAPQAALHDARTQELLARRRQLDATMSAFRRIDELQGLQSQLDKALREPASRRESGRDVGVELHEFSKRVESLLKEWRWIMADSRVVFDRKTSDLVVDGKERASNGKGVRALTHAAFTLGLLKHCRDRALPHPGFVVLDSPLTTYKERKGSASPQEIHDAFFRSVATSFASEQVIVLENKEPSDDIKPLLTFIDFAGDRRFGRLGFFEPPDDASVTPALVDEDDA